MLSVNPVSNIHQSIYSDKRAHASYGVNLSAPPVMVSFKARLITGWGPECRGYKILTSAGLKDELIDKTIGKMKLKDAKALKHGLNNILFSYPDRTISAFYGRFYKDFLDDEKSASLTFKLLAEIFKRCRDRKAFLLNVNEAVKMYGTDVFKKGKLNDGDIFGDSFRFITKDGQNIAERFKERKDIRTGNIIRMEIDSNGKYINNGKGLKYSPTYKLLEEWEGSSRTKYYYDNNGKFNAKTTTEEGLFITKTTKSTLIDGKWEIKKELHLNCLK